MVITEASFRLSAAIAALGCRITEWLDHPAAPRFVQLALL